MNVLMHPNFSIGANAILRNLDFKTDAHLAAVVSQIRSMGTIVELACLIDLADTIASTWENVKAVAPFSERGQLLRRNFDTLIKTTANAMKGYVNYVGSLDPVR